MGKKVSDVIGAWVKRDSDVIVSGVIDVIVAWVNDVIVAWVKRLVTSS